MEEYEYMSHEDVARLSDYFLEKYRRAYIALANAESIEDGRKYFEDDLD